LTEGIASLLGVSQVTLFQSGSVPNNRSVTLCTLQFAVDF
jgi:hypothetical protein